MSALIGILSELGALLDLYHSQPYSEPIRQARGYLEPVLDAGGSRIAVTALVALVSLALTFGFYFVFLKPAAQIMRWLAWLAFVLGVPGFLAYLAWTVPQVYSQIEK
jgi:hypothetical protein